MAIDDDDGVRVNANRGFNEAPSHRALRAQAEKEEAYRPVGVGVPSGVVQPFAGLGWLKPAAVAVGVAAAAEVEAEVPVVPVALGDRGWYDRFEVRKI